MEIPPFIERVAANRNCTTEQAQEILTDCLGQLHEASFKGGIGVGLLAAYFELGPLAAWHYMGLLVKAAESGEPGELIEHYQRLDPSLTRFSEITERWSREAGVRPRTYRLERA